MLSDVGGVVAGVQAADVVDDAVENVLVVAEIKVYWNEFKN